MSTPAAHIRATIVDAIQGTEAGALMDSSVMTSFEAGEYDVPLDELHLDSLVRMELMVALEMEHGAVITPQVFAGCASLSELVEVVRGVEGAARRAASQEPAGRTEGETSAEPGVAAPRLVRLFRRAFGSCRTVAHVDRLITRFEGRMTPLEARTLWEWNRRGRLFLAATHAPYAGVIDGWLERLDRWMSGSGKADPEPFTSERIAPAAVHFGGPGSSEAKTLVICFSNIGGRIVFVPNPVLLQHFDASRYELLILSDPRATAFRTGVPHMGATVTEVVQWVANLELPRRYAHVRVLGGSAGAYPAMLTGRRIDAEFTVGISGRFPSERYLGTVLKMYFLCLTSFLRNRKARVLLVHGTRRRGDAAYARRLARLTGTGRLAVDMPGRRVEHNILEPLIEHAELGALLERTILAPVDAPWFDPGSTSETMVFPIESQTPSEGPRANEGESARHANRRVQR